MNLRVEDRKNALTVPLVTDASGRKFGKSEGNAVWLDPKKTSPFRFYQFWINLPDDGIENYLKVYTTLPLADIDVLMEEHKKSPQARLAQEMLARLVTEAVHGPAAVAEAGAATEALFGKRPFAELSTQERAVAFAEAPSLNVSHVMANDGYALTDALVGGQLASSKSDARRLIEGKGVSINEFPIENPDQKLYPGDFRGNYAIIRKGKRDVLVLVLK